jgi:hypothetical protein
MRSKRSKAERERKNGMEDGGGNRSSGLVDVASLFSSEAGWMGVGGLALSSMMVMSIRIE